MKRNHFVHVAVRVLLALAMLLVAAAAFAQSTENIQLAANIPPTARTAADPAVTLDTLQGRIDAQQREIAELRALVTALQTQLQIAPERLASARPMLPPNRPNFDPGPPPSPSPSPSPAPQPAPAAPAAAAYRAPRELLPDIGQIGAEIGLLAGMSTNPYKDNNGFATAGFIDLPWKNVPGGKLSYEIMVGLQRSATNQPTTSGVNVLVNGIVNSYLGNGAGNKTSLTSYLAGPLPITSNTTENAKVLTVAPLLLKYAFTNMGRFRPYFVFGLGTYVWIGSNNNSKSFDANAALGSLASAPVGSSTLGATLNAILQGSQIGGLVPTAPELAARGVAQGQGNILFGGQFGGGFEVRVSPRLSMGVDFRRNQVEGTNASFNAVSFKQGLHW